MPALTSNTPTVDRLKTWRDEIRVQVHLASMEIRKKWKELEPEVEQLLNTAETAGTELSQDLIKRFRALRRSIASGRRPAQAAARAKTRARKPVTRSPQRPRATH